MSLEFPQRPDKRRKYDDAFRAHALQLAQQSRSTARAARALGLSPKLLYLWQQHAHQQARQAAPGSEAVAAETPQERPLRQQVRWLEQEVEMLKKALIILSPKTLVSTYTL